MKYIVLLSVFLIILLSSCAKDEGYRDRVITSDIVGKWYSKKSSDSIVQIYTVNGKLTHQRYQNNVLKYTGYFDYDITGQTQSILGVTQSTMEYWGENTDNQTPITITNKDTLWQQNFIGHSYTLFRIKTN